MPPAVGGVGGSPPKDWLGSGAATGADWTGAGWPVWATGVVGVGAPWAWAGAGVVTISSFSVGLAITWMCTWFWPAKNNPCPTGNWLSRFFSSLVSLKTSDRTSTAVGDCLSRNCMLALATIALPIRLAIKSSTSWVTVVRPRLYLRARLA